MNLVSFVDLGLEEYLENFQVFFQGLPEWLRNKFPCMGTPELDSINVIVGKVKDELYINYSFTS